MNPLESAILKVEWAHEHLNVLDSEVADVFGPKMLSVMGEFNVEQSNYVYRRKAVEPPNQRWGLMVGNIAAILRSSLDHIAWQLALQKTEHPSINIYFPLFERIFTSLTSPDAVNIIKRFQPYHTTNPMENSLWVISEVARIDKHRGINILVLSAG